ncbi:hypothetical protein GCM10022296_21150 [Secundilactobacillus similis DSM 23365 = JCM 2765]|nr:BspA family leucine-rich repeat surface protein [Secundilactobacillus similis]
MNKHGRSLGETKTHFKMYKKGRNWMVAGVAMTSFGLSVVGFGTQTAKADTATTDADATAVSTATTDNQEVALKTGSTSQAESTGTAQAATSSTTAATSKQTSTTAASTTDAVKTVTEADESASTTVAKATASDNATTATTPDTTTATKSGSTNSETAKATSATGTTDTTANTDNQITATSASVETPTSIQGSETVTNLKTAGDAAFEAAKKVASENYKTLGTAQKIVRMADSAVYTLANGDTMTTGADFTINTTPTGTDIADGTFGTSQWQVSDDGILHIGAGELGTSHATLSRSNGYYTWSASNWTIFQDDIKAIDIEEGVTASVDASYLFASLAHVTYINGLKNLDTSKTQNFTRMFAGVNDISGVDVSTFDTSSATTLSGMFAGDGNLYSVNAKNWDVSKVTDFSYMFSYTGIQSLDLSGWNTSSGRSYDYMFQEMSKLTQITLGSGFTITPKMPTIVTRDDNDQLITLADWIGQGTGTILAPQGREFVNTTYSGNAADADTYFLNTTGKKTFLYNDTSTGAIIKTETVTGKVGSSLTYQVAIPDGYTAVIGDPTTYDVWFTVDDGYTQYINIDPITEETYTQTYKSSVTKADGTPVATQSGTTTYDLVVVKPSLMETLTRGQIEAINSVTYENEIAENASITDTIPDGYEISAVHVSLTGPTGVVAMYYNYQTQDATMTTTSIDANGQKTVLDWATLLDKEGVTVAQNNKQALDQLLKVNGNQVTVPFDKMVAGGNLAYSIESIAYTISPTAQTRTVNYINKLDNTQVSSDTISGVTDESGTYTVTAPAGYALAPGQATAIAYTLAADNTAPFEVSVIPAISKLPDESQTPSTLTVHYVDQNGKPVSSSVAQNGTIGTPFTVTAPTISGYTLVDPNQATVDGTYAGNAMALTLVYKALPATTGTDTTGDDTTAPATTTTSTTPAQVVTTPTTETTSTSEANANVTPATAEPEAVVTDKNAAQATTDNGEKPVTTTDNGKTIASVATINVSSANAAAVSTSSKTTATKVTAASATAKLPQTSETTGTLGALIGAVLLSAASLLGFGIKKQRRN